MNSCIRVSGDYLFLDVKAFPGASKSALGEVQEGRIKVRIAATAEDNKANDELLSFLAKLLGISKKNIVLESGRKSRLKTLSLPVSVKEKLEMLIGWVPERRSVS